MTRIEFGKIMAYTEAGCGKALATTSAQVYFEMLGDLAPEVLAAAAQLVLLQHQWATFPSIAELRRAANEILYGPEAAGENWLVALASRGKREALWPSPLRKAIAAIRQKALPTRGQAIGLIGFEHGEDGDARRSQQPVRGGEGVHPSPASPRRFNSGSPSRPGSAEDALETVSAQE